MPMKCYGFTEVEMTLQNMVGDIVFENRRLREKNEILRGQVNVLASDQPPPGDTPISALAFTKRVHYRLRGLREDSGEPTLDELLQSSEEDLMAIRCFGEAALREVRGRLARWGLALPKTRGGA